VFCSWLSFYLGLYSFQELEIALPRHTDCFHIVLDNLRINLVVLRYHHGPPGSRINQDMM
jgi:hypothetical protein